jgi:hypothetical protein
MPKEMYPTLQSISSYKKSHLVKRMGFFYYALFLKNIITAINSINKPIIKNGT